MGRPSWEDDGPALRTAYLECGNREELGVLVLVAGHIAL